MPEISTALNKLIEEMNPFEKTDSERYHGWRMLMGRWITAVQIGLKYEPLIICGDDYERMMKFYTGIAHALGCSRKITLVSTSNKLLTNGWFKTFHKYEEEITEAQANLMVLIDRFEPGRTYEDIVERYKDVKTNVLILGNSETWKLNRLNRSFTIVSSKPLPEDWDDSDLNGYLKDCQEANDKMQTKFHPETNKHMKEYKRPQPLIIHNSNRSMIRKWFEIHYSWLKTDPRIKTFDYEIPKMRRYDVSKKALDLWLRDINALKNEVSKYNIMVFDFNDVDISKMDAIDSKLAHADPSGDCLLVYIVPDDAHGIAEIDWSVQHMIYKF